MRELGRVGSTGLFLSIALGASGCGSSAEVADAGTDAAASADAPRCVPDEATFTSDIRPRIERYCGQCHGETPDFGAPSSLLDHDRLLAEGPMGVRLVDLIASRLHDGTMPPTGMPRVAEAEADAIASWASCGAVDVPPATGLVSSAPPFLAPDEGPAGLEALDFLANKYAVGPDVRDDYHCFVFDADVTEDRFVRRFEMVYDETRVLHHLVLLRDPERHSADTDYDCYDGSGMPPGSQYLYAWAPGQSAIEFPEGGLRISPGERFIVQIHYNNGASVPDVRDSSGVRLLHGPAEGTEYGMIAIGPTDFAIPPRMRRTTASRCTVREESTLFVGMPHMHLLGTDFHQSVARAGGAVDPIIQLGGWSFETQLFYDFRVALHPGDVITTRCTFQNTTSETVTSGEDTNDEMCFDFAYVTPPPSQRYCDEGDEDNPTDVAYRPSACLPAGTSTEVPLVRGRWIEAATPPALPSVGPVPDGRWLLESADAWVTGLMTPIGNIDTEATYSLSRGQVVVQDGVLTYDVWQDTVVKSESGIRFGGPAHYDFAVRFDASASPLRAPFACPADATGALDLVWGVEGDQLTVEFQTDSVPGQTLWSRFVFRRAP
jgi:mono/diheme cytochrome c family protein